MRAEERRQAIRELLQNSKQPVSASALAARFAVSRQIIVGDIALLRAAGAEISAPAARSRAMSPTMICRLTANRAARAEALTGCLEFCRSSRMACRRSSARMEISPFCHDSSIAHPRRIAKKKGEPRLSVFCRLSRPDRRA